MSGSSCPALDFVCIGLSSENRVERCYWRRSEILVSFKLAIGRFANERISYNIKEISLLRLSTIEMRSFRRVKSDTFSDYSSGAEGSDAAGRYKTYLSLIGSQ